MHAAADDQARQEGHPPPPSDSVGDEPPGPLATRVYRIPVVADMLGASERFVYALIAEGKLRKVAQSPRLVGVRDDDLAAYIDACTLDAAS